VEDLEFLDGECGGGGSPGIEVVVIEALAVLEGVWGVVDVAGGTTDHGGIFGPAWREGVAVVVSVDEGAAVGGDIEGGFDLLVDPGFAGGGGTEFLAEAGLFPFGEASAGRTVGRAWGEGGVAARG